MADSKWDIKFYRVAGSSHSPIFTRLVIWFCGGGFLLSAILLINVSWKQTKRLEHIVKERTKDLSNSNKSLVDEIAERKRSEEKIKQQQYYLEKAQGLGEIGTWELDLIQNVLFWTDENCRIFGVPSETLVTYELFLDKIHPDDLEYVSREWNAALDGKPYDIEHRIVIDGTTRWVREKADVEFDEEGVAIKAIGFSQDITRRKEDEEALLISEKRFRDIAISSGDWFWEVDQDGRYTYASEKIESILGYSLKEIIGKTPFDFMPPNENIRIKGIFSAILKEKRAIKDLENWNLAKNGDKICLLTNGVPLLNDLGEVIGYRGVDKDITESKKAENELEKYHEHLEEVVQDRTKELQTVINAMSGREVRMAELKEEVKSLKDQLYQAGG